MKSRGWKNHSFLFFILIFIVFIPTTQAKEVLVSVSVDWEGDRIIPHAIRSMKQLRQQHPDVPFIHFLNAAYYTKPNAVEDKINASIQEVTLPGDEMGLHLHGWKTLMESAGVTYRSTPSIVNKNETRCYHDCGHTISLDAYTEQELTQVIAHSIDILTQQGYSKPISFRAGAWIADKKVLNALAQNGIIFDSSAVPWEHLSMTYSNQEPFKSRILKYWGDINSTSQPYTIQTPYGLIHEMPDNGCLADYMSWQDMIEVFKKNVALWKSNPETAIHIHIGLHHETASTFSFRVGKALELMKKIAEEEQLPLRFITFEKK